MGHTRGRPAVFCVQAHADKRIPRRRGAGGVRGRLAFDGLFHGLSLLVVHEPLFTTGTKHRTQKLGNSEDRSSVCFLSEKTLCQHVSPSLTDLFGHSAQISVGFNE
jgi:hypothetical protein